MALLRYNIKLVLTVLLITIQLTLSVKTNARPVYEVINEQSKAEEKSIKTSAVASLPYGNPLAGNSQHNAKLHAHNQQAMFNAERVRQHKAQIQRWMETPQANNYMRAYHELQENHQLELEQRQTIKDEPKQTLTREPSRRHGKDHSDIQKLSKTDTVKSERKRNHRSHGSVEYQTVYVPMAPSAKLYSDSSANIKYVHNQFPPQDYQTIQDIETLNSLLNKNPGDQLTRFNDLINSHQVKVNHDKELETPIDLYFHLKAPSNLPEHYDQTRYAHKPIISETHTKELTPIEEENVESREMLQYNEQPRYIDVPTTKNIQYINSEMTDQIINAGFNPLYQEEYKIKEVPTYEALQYGHRPVYDQNNPEDLNHRHLHHNAHKGVHHLAQDGSEISAYDDEYLNYAASYEFGYRVRDMHSGNDFGHQEEKKGEETSGQYHVLLPDGRMQNVKYSAGPDGFHADISYDGRK